MNEKEAKEQSILRTSAGLMGVVVASCVVKTCQFIFQKPEKVKGGFKVGSE